MKDDNNSKNNPVRDEGNNERGAEYERRKKVLEELEKNKTKKATNENLVNEPTAAEPKKKVLKLKLTYVLAVIVILSALVGTVYFLTSGQASQALSVVASGDNVSVFYTLTLTNGTVLQSNFGAQPFSFVVGSGQVIQGFNDAVIGMKVGEAKNVTLPPNEAYGNYSSALIVTVPRSDFGNASINVGETVSNKATGQKGIITVVNSTSATINFNSPLAGETLLFEIKIASINK